MENQKDVLGSIIEQYFEENLIGKFGDEQGELVKASLRDFATHYLGWKPEVNSVRVEISWDEIPAGFNFAAMDEGGTWFLYTHKPTIGGSLWMATNENYIYDMQSKQYVSKYDNTNRYILFNEPVIDWKKTLQERPAESKSKED